ncbi:hypothetical protein FB451DRAFT_1025405, partial [Mycena latifolia]
PRAAPARVRPTNFLSLSRGDSPLTGSYVIDPRVKIPQSLLPPLASGETEATRRNVFLQTTRGPIDVDLLIVGDATSKVDILVQSSIGPITTRLHASTSPRPPIHITAESSKAPITIHLPPTFCGPVTIRTGSGTVRFAGRLMEDVTTLSEADHTRRCFVGDFADWTEEWAGDVLNVKSASGSVTLLYEDDREANAWDTPGSSLSFPWIDASAVVRDTVAALNMNSVWGQPWTGHSPAFPHFSSFHAHAHAPPVHPPGFFPGMGADERPGFSPWMGPDKATPSPGVFPGMDPDQGTHPSGSFPWMGPDRPDHPLRRWGRVRSRDATVGVPRAGACAK